MAQLVVRRNSSSQLISSREHLHHSMSHTGESIDVFSTSHFLPGYNERFIECYGGIRLLPSIEHYGGIRLLPRIEHYGGIRLLPSIEHYDGIRLLPNISLVYQIWCLFQLHLVISALWVKLALPFTAPQMKQLKSFLVLMSLSEVQVKDPAVQKESLGSKVKPMWLHSLYPLTAFLYPLQCLSPEGCKTRWQNWSRLNPGILALGCIR